MREIDSHTKTSNRLYQLSKWGPEWVLGRSNSDNSSALLPKRKGKRIALWLCGTVKDLQNSQKLNFLILSMCDARWTLVDTLFRKCAITAAENLSNDSSFQRRKDKMDSLQVLKGVIKLYSHHSSERKKYEEQVREVLSLLRDYAIPIGDRYRHWKPNLNDQTEKNNKASMRSPWPPSRCHQTKRFTWRFFSFLKSTYPSSQRCTRSLGSCTDSQTPWNHCSN